MNDSITNRLYSILHFLKIIEVENKKNKTNNQLN